MDPTKLFRTRGTRESTEPRRTESNPFEFIQPTEFISDNITPSDGCSYSSFIRTRCVNGECKEEMKRFRSCPGRPKEIAKIDPVTKEEIWRPATTEERMDEFDSFGGNIPSAIGTLLSDIEPELERMKTNLQMDPFFDSILRDLVLPRGYVPPVPFQRHTPAIGSREIPITGRDDQSSSQNPSSRNFPPAPSHRRDHHHTLENLAHSVQAFGESQQMNRLLTGRSSSSTSESNVSPTTTSDSHPNDSDSDHE